MLPSLSLANGWRKLAKLGFSETIREHLLLAMHCPEGSLARCRDQLMALPLCRLALSITTSSSSAMVSLRTMNQALFKRYMLKAIGHI